jgi:outer membrane protein assembly factor BamB
MRRTAFVVIGALVATALVGAGAQGKTGCASGDTGGDWPSFGHDLSNTRSQPALRGSSSGDLQPGWAFSSTAGGGAGNFQSTAAVAGGCVYVGTSGNSVFALNADTGDALWTTTIGEGGAIGGIFAVSVKYGRVFLLAGGAGGPFGAALDQDTGKVLWETALEDPSSSGVNASAVVFDGLLFAAVFGGDGDPTSHPPFFILDAFSGKILKKTYIIPKKQWKEGYAGSGMWATGVVDTEGKYLFAGTSNPYSKRLEHEHSNAILKIDLDRDRKTFGEIVDSYKGDVDQYFQGLDDQPACQMLGDYQTAGYSVFCAQLDIDFGASPNLFTDSEGRQIVGSLQKSGVYHAAFADSMKPAWTALLTYPSAPGNAGTSAVDAESIYVAVNPGLLYSIDKDDGATNWTAPLTQGVSYQTVTVAGGIVYIVDNKGFLNGFDAETGTQVVNRPMAMDASDACISLSGGVAVARNRVYATCDIGAAGGGWLVAYDL